MVQVVARRPDGTKHRVRRTCARQDEARKLEAELRATKVTAIAPPKEVPTLATFADTFVDTFAKSNNRPSTAREKRRCLDRSILPALGGLRLDAIGPRHIEAFKAKRLADGVVAKTINEELAILGKLLRVALEWEVIERVPSIRRLKTMVPDFDFLDFEEADRLVAAAKAEGEPWSTMILVALRTGLRQGELRGLRWQDVDTVSGRIVVRVAVDDRNTLHPPKSGRAREVPLGDEVLAALRAFKHLRGPLVFCNTDGSMLSQRQLEHPIARVCKRAGLRSIGWHCCRHSFASHLAMRGATM